MLNFNLFRRIKVRVELGRVIVSQIIRMYVGSEGVQSHGCVDGARCITEKRDGWTWLH